MKKTQTILVRVSKETLDKLHDVMIKTKVFSRSEVCRAALIEYLDKMIEVKKKTKLT